MNPKLLQTVTSAIFAMGLAVGANFTNFLPANAKTQKLSLYNRTQNLKQNQKETLLAISFEEKTNIRVYELASQAVVSIDTDKTNGSGTIITPDGMVLTNAHVVSQGGVVTVTLADGKKVEADVIGFGEKGLDLAVLKIRGERNLPTVKIASPNSIKVGQRAFAIGNPFGRFQGTLTVGIVSRIDKERGLIQTDAAINPGNSGGPLLNSYGQLIGVNTAIFTRGQLGGNIGIGFAISIDSVPDFLQAVEEGRAPLVAQQPSTMFDEQQAEKLNLNGLVEVDGNLGTESKVLPVDNSYYDLYAFEGKAGQKLSIDMSSKQIDPYLILLSSNGQELAQDDDSGGEKNARIVITLPENGTYKLLANSYEAGESGDYKLKIEAFPSSIRPFFERN
ncbi:MAG: trypsin-like peptidase domain-containing protein [Microcoleaceae cyanobacterium MO_207.B10]|nr:trypsin-like peptidase domain-containing protein [Microcoleaceae cyanobacterium MO_207.B10]